MHFPWNSLVFLFEVSVSFFLVSQYRTALFFSGQLDDLYFSVYHAIVLLSCSFSYSGYTFIITGKFSSNYNLIYFINIYSWFPYHIICILCLFLGTEIEISFKNFSSSDKDHLELEIELLPFSETKAILTNIPQYVDFVIFQVHSFLHGVILSYNTILSTNNYVNGTNVGLYSNASNTAFFYIKNLHDFNVSCMIAVVPYTNESK